LPDRLLDPDQSTAGFLDFRVTRMFFASVEGSVAGAKRATNSVASQKRIGG